MKNKIKKLALTYYSRKDVQEAIYNFCKKRETVARHQDSFGKRPDSLDYPSDVIQQVKKGFTSFHCSEEHWKDPLKLSTGMSEEEKNYLREGWDLVIDIDCEWFDYSKKAAKAVVDSLNEHGVENIGIKFSGSKGMHILVPWKAFPKRLGENKTKDLFPDLPRKIASYLRYYSERLMEKNLPEDFFSQFKNVDIKKGVKCKSCNKISKESRLIVYHCPSCGREEKKIKEKYKDYKCPECKEKYKIKIDKPYYNCESCNKNNEDFPDNFSTTTEIDLFELMDLDIVLVSSRHLFRAPYSLHEKGLASIVINKEDIEDFQPKSAKALGVEARDFYPEARENEAKELVTAALDWHKEEPRKKKSSKDFKNIRIDKKNITYPPCIKNILQGVKDGKKRALFILMSYFRSVGMNFEEIEEKLDEWNEKNKKKKKGLKQGYITSQISWNKNNKSVLPPNCDKENYKAIGVCTPDNTCKKIKNPINYTVRKQFAKMKNKKDKPRKKNEKKK